MKLSEILVPEHDLLFGLAGGVQYEATLQAEGEGFRLIGHRVAISSDPEEPVGSAARAALRISSDQLQDDLVVVSFPTIGWKRVVITGRLLAALPDREIFFRPKQASVVVAPPPLNKEPRMRIALMITPREILAHATAFRMSNLKWGAEGQATLQGETVHFKSKVESPLLNEVDMAFSFEGGMDQEIEVQDLKDGWYSLDILEPSFEMIFDAPPEKVGVLSFQMPNVVFQPGT